jgi:uncharacterized OB-fold protein
MGNEHSRSQELLNEEWFWHPVDRERPQLAGGRCRECGLVLFPQGEFCPACGTRDTLDREPLDRTGKLYAFSVAYVAPAGFESPYAFGYVQLPKGPRLFARLVDCDPPEERLKIGMAVELVLAPIRVEGDGRMIWGYAFKPARQQAVPHA